MKEEREKSREAGEKRVIFVLRQKKREATLSSKRVRIFE